MTTVTAKALRDNLSSYLDRLEEGEEIVIIRHSEIIGSLKPNGTAPISNGRAVGAMLEQNKAFFKTNTNLSPESSSSKDLYHEALEEKYGL